MTEIGSIDTQGEATVVKAFDNLDQTLFFGIIKTDPQTQAKSVALRVVFATHDVIADNAHTDIITAIEYAKINNIEVVFSASQDMKLKAWKVSDDGKQL